MPRQCECWCVVPEFVYAWADPDYATNNVSGEIPPASTAEYLILQNSVRKTWLIGFWWHISEQRFRPCPCAPNRCTRLTVSVSFLHSKNSISKYNGQLACYVLWRLHFIVFQFLLISVVYVYGKSWPGAGEVHVGIIASKRGKLWALIGACVRLVWIPVLYLVEASSVCRRSTDSLSIFLKVFVVKYNFCVLIV